MEDPRDSVAFTDLARDLASAVEALLFAADEPLRADDVARMYRDVTGIGAVTAADVEAVVAELNDAYEATGRTFRIERWAGGFRMATVGHVSPFIRQMLQGARRRKLSRTLLETLAILAYRQPVTKPEIDFVRGVDSDYAVRKLLEIGLVDVVGRSDALGRPLLYGTTARFLETFGLESLEHLPTLREIEELLDDPRFKRERAKLLTEVVGDAEAAEPTSGSAVDDTTSPDSDDPDTHGGPSPQ